MLSSNLHARRARPLEMWGTYSCKKKQVWVRLCCSSSQHRLPAVLAELGNNRLCKAKGFHVRHLETWHRGDAEPPSPEACPPACHWGCGMVQAAAGMGRDGMQQEEACAQLECQLESQRFFSLQTGTFRCQKFAHACA